MTRVGAVAAPLVVGVAGLAAWEAVVTLGRVAPFVLPAPSVIAEQFWTSRDVIWRTALASGANALVGLIIGSVLAVIAALIASRFPAVHRLWTPLLAVLNALPIIAVAPLLNNAYESTSSLPRRLVVALVVFFPVFLNTLRGLTEVDPTHLELMRSYAATGAQVSRFVRLPGAVGYLATGLRQASSLSVIAAVVSEYFGGLQDGLGSRITSAAANTAYPRAWAFVLGACALGLLFYLVTLLIERLATPWQRRHTT
jgi:NitT/TauT family transport system permease protein